MFTWPELTLPPLNLWNFRNWRYDVSGGIEEMFREAGETAMYKHYKKVTPEPIDVIEGWGLGFNLGNAIKYIGRSPYKDQRRSDLEKAIWYLQRELDLFKD